MSDEAITNSACLIVLERIGRLELLPGLFNRVWAPPEVEAEIGAKPPWLELRVVENRGVIAALLTQVEEGEAATMALALEMPGVPVILDDKKPGGSPDRWALN